MNILMLVDDLNIGGTGTHILSISKALIRYNFKITIVTKEGKLKDVFKKNNIDVILLNIFDDINSVSKEILKIYNSKDIDLIHAHLPQSIKVASFLKDLYGINYVSSLHGLFYNETIINLCKNANNIICVSEPVVRMLKDYLPTFPVSNIHLIYNTIHPDINIIENVRDSLNIDNNTKLITYCSRLNNSKGILAEKFLHKFYSLSKSDDNINAIILGNGPRKRHLDFYSNMINEELGQNRVHILGDVYNPCDYFIESNAVVGTGRVLIEALSCNTACIALGSKGYAGLVEPSSYDDMIYTYFGEHESVFKPKYSFEESFNIILDDNLRKPIIYNNKLWFEDIFNEDSSILKLISIYKKSYD
ncbi:glycosyltransferase [Paraclostridium dentum]|uniref:glycosyltransferase n=1 Tax=Paraclostridium dentum TaxID=2662455 RepID=UPI003F3B35A3